MLQALSVSARAATSAQGLLLFLSLRNRAWRIWEFFDRMYGHNRVDIWSYSLCRHVWTESPEGSGHSASSSKV